jgi:hypothetical protein
MVPQESQPFEAAALAADLAVIRGLIETFFRQVKPADWERPTESRPTGWTLKQAFCHVVAAAELFDQALEGGLSGGLTFSSPLNSRTQLPAFNQAQITIRQHLLPETLLHSFLDALTRSESRISGLPDSVLERPIPLNAYNRPMSLAVIAGNQLIHPSLVHGAQLANGIGAEPLWRHFSADFMHRQLTRFFHVFSHTYWPERGGDLTAAINFNIRGSGGGHWYVRLGRDGGSVGEGLAERPSLTLHFANPDAFCSLFTLQRTPMQGLLTGQVFGWPNIPLAFKLPYLFTPT